jgi:hypothetical protein
VESVDLSDQQPERFARMKQQLLAWNESVEASFAGRDYPEGRLVPPDPEPQSWYDSPAYAPFVPQWKDRWEFRSYLERRTKAKKIPAKKTAT